MNTKLPYSTTKESIKGYTESKIAFWETNDCVVRAIASSFDITYDESHNFCEKTFRRMFRKGVMMFNTQMENFFGKGSKINNKTVELVGKYSKLYYDVIVKGETKKRKLTVGTFIKTNPKGTFLVTVSGHAFTIKDGVVIGNVEDAQKTKKILESVWKIA